MLEIDKKIKKQELLFLLKEHGQANTAFILGVTKSRLRELRSHHRIISRTKRS